MAHLKTVMEQLSVGYNIQGRNLVDEMNELGKLRTAVMMEKCSRRNEVVMCPKPRKNTVRPIGESNELRIAEDLSNILMSTASPPFYSGSPPVRSVNPLIHDPHFREQRQSVPATGARFQLQYLGHFVNGMRFCPLSN